MTKGKKQPLPLSMWFDKSEMNDGIRFNLTSEKVSIRLTLRPTTSQRLRVALEVW